MTEGNISPYPIFFFGTHIVILFMIALKFSIWYIDFILFKYVTFTDEDTESYSFIDLFTISTPCLWWFVKFQTFVKHLGLELALF